MNFVRDDYLAIGLWGDGNNNSKSHETKLI